MFKMAHSALACVLLALTANLRRLNPSSARRGPSVRPDHPPHACARRARQAIARAHGDAKIAKSARTAPLAPRGLRDRCHVVQGNSTRPLVRAHVLPAPRVPSKQRGAERPAKSAPLDISVHRAPSKHKTVQQERGVMRLVWRGWTAATSARSATFASREAVPPRLVRWAPLAGRSGSRRKSFVRSASTLRRAKRGPRPAASALGNTMSRRAPTTDSMEELICSARNASSLPPAPPTRRWPRSCSIRAAGGCHLSPRSPTPALWSAEAQT